ncbi:MAG: alpha amylase C-terminal domain-containing protein [Deltaproteobacteria bacterium]|nr:alpha amylase C-terminal domain-containing protein [Deltaproteobacteria bacterium]
MSSHLQYGARLRNTGTDFRVWAPGIGDAPVRWVNLMLFDTNGNLTEKIPMDNERNGSWKRYVQNVGKGQRYNFEIEGAGERLDPFAKEVTHSAGQSVVVDENDYEWTCNHFSMPLWNELIIYQMHVRTFPDKDRGKENQLNDVIEDMWYLKELGVNAIELLPTAKFAGDISFGYNPSNIFAVESAYGGPRQLKHFVDMAHLNGMAVLLDVVYNHLQPDNRGLWQFTPWHQDNYGGVYFYNDWRATTPEYGDNRPDYGRMEVRNFLRENALMWLDEYRIDGLRFDSTGNIRSATDKDNDPASDLPDGWQLMRAINNTVDVFYPWKIMIAEDLKNNESITGHAEGDYLGGAGFDSQWEEVFYHGIKHTLTLPEDHQRSMAEVAHALESRYNGQPFKRIIFIENHDKVADKENSPGRLPELIEPGNVDTGWFARKRSMLGAAMLLSAPGIPMIHQGQEVLEWRRLGSNPEKTGVDWDRFCEKDDCANCRKNNSNCQPNGRFAGIYFMFRDLIHLRRNWFDNTRGLRGENINVFHQDESSKVLAFHRWQNGGARDDVIVVANFSNWTHYHYSIGLPGEGRWRVRLNTNYSGYDSFEHHTVTTDMDAENVPWDGMPCCGSLDIGPWAAIIFSQD